MAIPGQVTTRSTITFVLYARRNNTVWDLTGATVTFKITDPDGVSLTRTATISDATNGIANYTTTIDEITTTGTWYKKWRVQQDDIDIWSTFIPQEIYPGG